MEVTRILAEIDAQITKLQQARALLSGSASGSLAAKKGVGRPRKNAATVPAASKQAVVGRKKRNLSPEARKRIADAQKKRWAEKRQDA